MATAFRPHGLWPDRRLYFANMSLLKQQHTQPGLADASADGQRQFPVKESLVELAGCAFHRVAQLQLAKHRILVNTDSHGGQFKTCFQDWIVHEDVTVEPFVLFVRRSCPVIVIGGAPVVFSLVIGNFPPMPMMKTAPYLKAAACSRCFGVKSGYSASKSSEWMNVIFSGRNGLSWS